MSDKDLSNDLPGYLTGELDAVGEARVKSALDSDHELRRDLDELSGVMTALETLRVASREEPADGALDRPVRKERGNLGTMSLGILAAAAAALLVLGVALMQRDSAQPAEQQYALEPIGDQIATGTAEMHVEDGATLMDLSFLSLEDTPDTSYYEAWLLSPADSPPISLGIVPNAGGTVVIPDGLPAEYTIVDVSIEQVDGDPSHSGISVLRSDPV